MAVKDMGSLCAVPIEKASKTNENELSDVFAVVCAGRVSAKT